MRAVIKPRIAIDDKGRAFVRGDDGDPMLRKGAISGDDYLSVADYKESLKADAELSYLFEPVGSKGSNAQPSSKPTPSAQVTKNADGTTVYS